MFKKPSIFERLAIFGLSWGLAYLFTRYAFGVRSHADFISFVWADVAVPVYFIGKAVGAK